MKFTIPAAFSCLLLICSAAHSQKIADFAGTYSYDGKATSSKSQSGSIWRDNVLKIDGSGKIFGSGTVEMFSAKSSAPKNKTFNILSGSKVFGPVMPFKNKFYNGFKASFLINTSHGAVIRGTMTFEQPNEDDDSWQETYFDGLIFGPSDERGILDGSRDGGR